MEHSDSTRSPLGIDLNEIPTTSCAETPTDSLCGVCGRPEAEADVVVCDACERGFHLDCAGMCWHPSTLVEWVCGECVKSGVKSKSWPLGNKKRILDINASPPSDIDGDAAEDVVEWRKHSSSDNSFGGNAFVAPVTYSKFLHAGNGYVCQKAFGITTNTGKTGFEAHTQSKDRSFQEAELDFPLGKLRSSFNNAIRFPSQNPSEILLDGLREFISERHGVLEEGWRVELKHAMNSYELYAVYCAPDGRTFDSMSEVACYLGLVSDYNPMDTKVKTEESALHERLRVSKKRKPTNFPIANGFAENKLISFCGKEFSSDCQHMETFSSRSNIIVDDIEIGREENGCTGFQQNNDGLPVQFDDFFILSLGRVDVRPSYHNVSMIYPVGYTSCWHDKVTGSLFICEVSDGGDSGPIFKVTRCSCSALPVPNGSTILFRSNLLQCSGLRDEANGDISSHSKDYDSDVHIQIILSDPCLPVESDILSCLGSSSNGNCDDEIGEISVEDRLSSSAWRRMSQKFIDACSEICKQKGVIKFSCKHIENSQESPKWDMMDEKNKRFTSLKKFCGFSVSIRIPSELETLADVLLKWLDQDRFGLDTEFVQEIIEQLPGVQSCLQYELLKDRSCYSALLTIGNGSLIAKMKDGVESKDEVSDGSFGRSKKPRLDENHDRSPPPGKALCSRFPSQMVGVFYQVWEFLWRFHEVLGLKEAFLMEELEEELINPWIDPEKCEKKVQGAEPLSLHQNAVMGEQMLSANNESYVAVSRENPYAFIQMETRAKKEASQVGLASVTYSSCSGVVLTKVHSSLLEVLICELQSKVAPLVDPNYDSGESKTRRGRKKETDSSIPYKRGKLNMLPINDLTWPELARRYVLSVFSMDGVLDSPEITARESGKVFRCLQGDGGMLCGSLAGVAGMEADALLLAEATKKVFGSLNREIGVLTIEDLESGASGSCEKNVMSDGTLPEWAKVLEPVRKLPTNVGTRIRKCVYDALEKHPPDWAKQTLEHSISKEVYKGNASGPTKKAVLSVLADVQKERLPQNSEKGHKKKTVISLSDIIMKQCRIVLRHAAAADDAKVFCNLLGRKPLSSTDNDDEGFLGSPAMVSRPLDFRTIDLRLAVGAYDGSHDAFLEDVRELWNNVHTAFGDQPNFVELAEKLSQNFESLYEKEVVTLVEKLVGYAKLECLSKEMKKEINDILAQTREIPKAPWDEGVCKVCGVDKDDDSVLLCDTCDAEYHTYCLDPPLAKIPKGNWYCPSCVSRHRVVQDASECSQVGSVRKGKKYQGEITHLYLEALRHLTILLEEKEYWEFSVDERTFLFKFLCDELLNSALLRQHLEQCAEATTELQQKLRSFSLELKNLKSREEIVVAKAAKVEASMLNTVAEVGVKGREASVKEGPATAFRNNSKCVGQPPNSSSRSNCSIVCSDDEPTRECGVEESGLNGSNEPLSVTFSEKNYDCFNQCMNSIDTEAQLEQSHGDNNRIPLANSLPQEIDNLNEEIHLQDNLQGLVRNAATQSPPSNPSEMTSHTVAEDTPTVAKNESQAYILELYNIKNDMLPLQESITTLEQQLLKLSVRREFLGTDSDGRLYWVSAMPGMNPRLIVDGSPTLQQRRKILDFQGPVEKGSILQNSISSGSDTCSTSEGSKACCPFQYDPNVTMVGSSKWVFYQTDAEIEELVHWLRDNDPSERELKESILQWKKLRFQDCQQIQQKTEDDCQSSLSTPTNSDKAVCSDCLVTKAATFLEKKHGPCFESETSEILKKGGKRARVSRQEKMRRCECLEPIWPSRNHCLSCHRTFSTDLEFEEHSDKCNSATPAHEKTKATSNSVKGKGNMKSDVPWEACPIDVDIIETTNSGCSEISSRLIKFQNEGCPFDLKEISSKLMTKDSYKELVQEIGLLGSNGIPSFIPSVSPFLSDSTLMLISPQKEAGISARQVKVSETLLSSEGNRGWTNTGNDSMADNVLRKSAANGIQEVLKSNKSALGYSEQREKKSSLQSHFPKSRFGHCCVVPQSSLRPLIGRMSQTKRRLKINLLDIDAALPEEGLRPSKARSERRWAWRAFVKSAETIYEMVQATIILEDMIKTEYLRSEWWYWSSLSAAAKSSTTSALALRIYSLDAAIVYEKSLSNLDPVDNPKHDSVPEIKPAAGAELAEKFKVSRKSSRKRKEPEG